MSEKSNPQRRDFLKTAAAGAAGAVALSTLRMDRAFAQTTGGWTTGMQVNPNIDNKRVVYCFDTKMLTSTPGTSFTAQNAAVDEAKVAANLDQMAMQLAQKTTAKEAWAAIFRSSKPWASTKVAIKTNAILGTNGNHPRVAVIKKICDVFVDQFGVPPGNIVLYDANSDASKCYSTYASLTDATKIRAVVSVKAQSLGGMVDVTIANVAIAGRAITGVADFVNGVTDILVDIAIVKRHSGPGTSYSFGSCSLCMKNHLGTFINKGSETGTGDASATGLHSLAAIFEINKHPAVLGGNPVRQQLCIVDGLLANSNGAGGTWDLRVDRLVMGTFAPTVDYLTATKIMSDVMGKPDANNNLPKFLTEFGYTTTDPVWVDATAAIVTPTGGSGGSSGAGGSSGGTTSTGGSKASGGSTANNGGSSAGGGTTASNGGSKAGGGTTANNGGSTVSDGGSKASNGGTSASNGGTTASNGGTVGAAGDNNAGTIAAGGTTANGGAISNGGAAGGIATSAVPPSGGSTATGGTFAQTGPGTTAAAGSTGSAVNTTHGASGGGCSVAAGHRTVTRWGAMAAVGAVLAARLRRLVSDDDRSS
jgi:hypothetical protein